MKIEKIRTHAKWIGPLAAAFTGAMSWFEKMRGDEALDWDWEVGFILALLVSLWAFRSNSKKAKASDS